MDSESGQSAGTILLVDDEEHCRKTIQRVLRSKGWTVCAAANARQAVAVYSAVCPDIVITDLLMAGGDGNLLLQELQRIDAAVCVIAITGLDPGDALVAKAVRGGAQAVLHKPFDGDALIATIRSVIAPA